MANGKASDPEDYVLRSGVRSGLKREFAFALKAQAELPLTLGRTRSGKSPVPSAVSFSRDNKRPKKSDAAISSRPPPIEQQLPIAETPVAVAVAVAVAVNGEDDLRTQIGPVQEAAAVENSIVIDGHEGLEKGNHSALSEKSPRRFTRSALKVVTLEDSVAAATLASPPSGKTETVMETPILADGDDIQKVDSGLLENRSVLETPSRDAPKADCGSLGSDYAGETPTDTDSQNRLNADSSITKMPIRTYTRSALKVMPEVSAVATPLPPLPIEQAGSLLSENPITASGNDGPKIDCSLPQKPTKRFTRSALKISVMEQEGPAVETSIVVVNQDGPKNGFSLPENPARRFTRSLIKMAVEDPGMMENSLMTGGGSTGLEEIKGGVGAASGSLDSTPNRKMELKLTKKIALTKLPSNVRELLATGLLEGLPVKYNSCTGKQVGLEGVIKGNGILCSCAMCQGSRVVSAYQFELHAHSTKKHPSDFIFLENGNSLHDVLRACTSVPLDMLETAIQNAIGPVPPKKPSFCQKCKELFHTPCSAKFALLCDSCLDPKLHQSNPSSSPRVSSNSKLPSKVLVVDASEGSSKNTSSQKKSIQGKLTRKDLGLHKLVFMDDILPQGTEVGYYVRGKRLLEGYIKDSGIYCHCCNNVVSPSQFEAHAGRAARRKPYNNIYTSNGVSLHELSVSLSKDRKLSPSENDDLCSICADGGDLILCDLCPRAFHKECVGLSSVPRGDWYCKYCQNLHQRDKCLAHNDNAIAAGRVAGVDPIEQIIKRSIRIVTTSTDVGGCVLCRCHDFSKSRFDQRTVLLCDQCEKEYHVGCLKDHNMGDLKELPEGEWFCCNDCSRIHAALQDLLRCGSETLQDLQAAIIQKKHAEKGLKEDGGVDVRWRLLSGKDSSADSKLLLSKAVSIFLESFDPIVDAVTGRDLIPSMVYGRNVRDQDFGGMYCAVLTVNSSVVSAGILRVLGCDAAELPLVATSRESQGQGYFQSLFSCIERLLGSLKVKNFVLPAAEEAESIWTKKFGFSKITRDQLQEYTKGARMMIFQRTSILHKPIPLPEASPQEVKEADEQS